MPTPVVVIVDDDQATRESLCALLSSYSMDCQAYESAESALAAPAAPRGTCFILDIQLPGMNGLDLCRKLADQGRAVIVMTAFVDHYTQRDALAAGAQAFLEKPCPAHELIATIQGLIITSQSPEI